jgi:thermitase
VRRRFEGLVFSTGSQAERARAKRVLRRAGIADWNLSLLGPGARQFFAEPPPSARVGVAAAWQLTYRLRADRDVDRAEPAFETEGFAEREPARRGVAAERHLPQSQPRDWALVLCGVREAWARPGAPQGQRVLIAHPDTGYTPHPQLRAALRPDLGYDFVEDVPDALDPLSGQSGGHGTATASVIASAVDAELVGVAPRAKIVPLRVNDNVIHFSWRRLAAALYRAADRRTPVASMSLGGPWGGSGALAEAVRRASEQGVIQIAAAGNHAPFVVYPACLPEVIAAAACNALGAPWQYTARGPEVDITAPGESVWRAKTSAGAKYRVERSSGTSYAAAHIAGMCALWLARHGGFAALAARYGGAAAVGGVFKEALQHSAWTPQGWDRANLGAGIARADALLDHALPASAPARGARFASARVPGLEALLVDIAELVRDELRFHAATDPRLRAALQRRARRLPVSGASRELRRALR